MNKLADLFQVGSLVNSIDGSVYRCTSKTASKDSFSYSLADLQGRSIKAPLGFRPISAALAKIAHWIRYVVAYNKDFDMYVKAYIQQAGLPIDPVMDWSKWFSVKIAPKLLSRDPEIQDEAIHQIIVKALVERKSLENFKSAIKKFPSEIQAKPLEKQVTAFLVQSFMWRVSEANRYIQKFIFQEDTDSMWAPEDGEDNGSSINLLDKPQFDKGSIQDVVEADIELDRFRRGFSDYLHNKFKEDMAEQYLTLFDVLYEEIKASEEAPGASDVLPEWFRQIGKKCPNCAGRGYTTKDVSSEEDRAKGYRPTLEHIECPKCEGKGATEGKSVSWFKKLFGNLPKLIDTFIVTHKKDDYEIHPFLEIMRTVGRTKKEREQMALDKLVHASLKTADDNEEDNQSSIPSTLNTLNTVGDIVGGIEEVAPMIALASTQWEVPKCKLCGINKEVNSCPSCKEGYCPECILTHHSNNPSHNKMGKYLTLDEVKCLGRDYIAQHPEVLQKIYDSRTVSHGIDYERDFHNCEDCEVFENGQWRTGVCDECDGDGLNDRGVSCSNCLGTGHPICCRCEGTGIDVEGSPISIEEY